MYRFENVGESDYTWSTISGAKINLAAFGIEQNRWAHSDSVGGEKSYML